MAVNQQDEQRLALFIDFENIAIGVRDAHYRKFDINLVLERLLDKGKLLVKKAYADWSRYSDYKRSFHEAAIELIEVPQKSVGGKNSAGRSIDPNTCRMDEWQLVMLQKVLEQSRVKVVSNGLDANTLRRCNVEPAASVEA